MSLALLVPLDGEQVRAPAVVLNEVTVVAADTLSDCLGCCPAEGHENKKKKKDEEEEQKKEEEKGRLMIVHPLPQCCLIVQPSHVHGPFSNRMTRR